MRIGHGYDVHLFAENRDLILGGVKIDYEKGLLGHSDADVLTHAVMDALLGAAGLGGIGKVLLGKTVALIEQKGFTVGNIDCTLIMLKPKISRYTEEMRKNLASHCHVTPQQVNVKATTEEGAGLGEKAAGAHAVCILNGMEGFFAGALF